MINAGDATSRRNWGSSRWFVLVPLAVALGTILVSTVMIGLSAESADESRRFEREPVWDIPIMDTLRLWKRSMGTVGSGKVKFGHVYENHEIQRFNTTERYYEKVLENTTRIYDEETNTWLNVTKNYTIYGNWTKTVTKSVEIRGLGQPTDTLISPDGLFMYVCTGFFTTSENYGGGYCSATRNDCASQIGQVSFFKRTPSDGSLFWAGVTRLDTSANLRKMIMSKDGAFIYVIEYDVGKIYTLSRDATTGNITLIDTIQDCMYDITDDDEKEELDTEEHCEKGNVSTSRFLQTAIDIKLSYDERNVYVASFEDETKNELNKAAGRISIYLRNETSGKLSYVGAMFNDITYFFVSLVLSRDGRHLYAGAVSSSSALRKATSGLIYMLSRNLTTGSQGELSLIKGFSTDTSDYGWKYGLELSRFVPLTNPHDTYCQSTKANREGYQEFCDEDITNIVTSPRNMLIDYDDRYLFVASYSNSRIVTFIRDSATGILIYKTTVQNEPNYIQLDEITTSSGDGTINYPIDMGLSGDGGSLYIATDFYDKVVVVMLETQSETDFPTALPTAVPTPDYYPQVDPLSYTNNLTCSQSSCAQIWPDAIADMSSSRFDSAFVCGGSCFSNSGRCRKRDPRCAFNKVVSTTLPGNPEADLNATVREANFSTWMDASWFCEASGARLCTVDELAFDETKGTGCWSEDALVWSSTACGFNITLAYGVNTSLGLRGANDTRFGELPGYYAIAPSARYPTEEAVCLTNASTTLEGETVATRVRCCADVICGGATPSPTRTQAPSVSNISSGVPSQVPSTMPFPKPTFAPTSPGYDRKLTFVEYFYNQFVLTEPIGIVVSPDWYSVYAVGTSSNTIVSLNRNATTPNPTGAPTTPPTPLPTYLPTLVPTPMPTPPPSGAPTPLPTMLPTTSPTPNPTIRPSPLPTSQPTPTPTTAEPSSVPTPLPTLIPTPRPSPLPTPLPTYLPTLIPTSLPTEPPTGGPTLLPTPAPTKLPTLTPTSTPTRIPTPSPTTPDPTSVPTYSPTTISQHYIRAHNHPEWCWTLPRANTPSGYRNGLVPFLARCIGAKSQRWSFDLKRKQIHPQNAHEWCLDSDFDKTVRRPLTVFRCGKTFSTSAIEGHQQWNWVASTNVITKSGTISNVATKRCAATGKEIYQGRYIQAWFCDRKGDDANQIWDFIRAD